ncbi:MAG TPA: DUF6526 family protein [Chitinophagaceae bacterium]|nr:DUF6526 family protein [Chitinophagaceae bacterium]
MPNQDFKHHPRYIPLWHFIVPLILLLILLGSILNLLHADVHDHYGAVTLLVIAILLPILYWYARAFALRAQDRAIKAEENFRHFVLTGKGLDHRLRLGQIIALRFAGDEEFPALCKRAVEEKLSNRQIKQAIRNWRADYNRV